MEYSSRILAEKILLIQENPKFKVIGRVNISFLIFPSTEFNFPTFLASQHPLGYLGIKIKDCLFCFYYFFKIAIVNSISLELQIVQVEVQKIYCKMSLLLHKPNFCHYNQEWKNGQVVQGAGSNWPTNMCVGSSPGVKMIYFFVSSVKN